MFSAAASLSRVSLNEALNTLVLQKAVPVLPQLDGGVLEAGDGAEPARVPDRAGLADGRAVRAVCGAVRAARARAVGHRAALPGGRQARRGGWHQGHQLRRRGRQ